MLSSDVGHVNFSNVIEPGPERVCCLQVLALSREGLVKRGFSEEGFLAPLEAIAQSGVTGAERLRDLFHGEWGGDIDRVYTSGITY